MTSPIDSRSVRFARNTGWNILGQAGLACMSFYLIPYLIRLLGTEGYALYGLMGVLSSYLGLLALGAGMPTLKYVSEFIASGKSEKLSWSLGLSLWMHGALVALGALGAIGAREFLVDDLFQVSASLRGHALWLFGCAAVASVFIALTQFGICALQGIQRYDLVNILLLLQPALLLGGSALILKLGKGLGAIGALYLAISMLLCGASIKMALSLLPVRPYWTVWSQHPSALWRSFMSYSLGAFATQIAWSVAFQWDKVFIGHMLPLSQLTYYLIPSFLLQKFWLIPSTIASTAFPMLSELHGTGDQESLKRIYRKCTRLILWLVLPGFVFLMILSPQLLTLWLGGDFSLHGTWPMRLLVSGYFIYFLTTMANSVSFGANQVRPAVYATTALAALCCIFWRFLIPKYGINGAALGFAAAQALSSLPLLLLINKKIFAMPLSEYLKEICLGPMVAGGVLIVFLWFFRFHMFTWPSLLLLAGLSCLLYYGIGWKLLSSEEHENLAQFFSSFRRSAK